MNNITYLIAGALGGLLTGVLLPMWLARRKRRAQEKVPLFESSHGLKPAAAGDTLSDARYWLGRFHGVLRAHMRRKPEPHDPPTPDNQSPEIEFANQDVLMRKLLSELQAHAREVLHARKHL